MSCKWRYLILSPPVTNEIYQIKDIQTKVMVPLLSLLDIYDEYGKALEEHKKLSQDTTQGIRTRLGIDEKPSDRSEQFSALDHTLKDELPKLFSMTVKLIQACLGEFVRIQEQWYRSFEENLKAATGIECIGVQDIINDWHANTSKPFSEITKLGICNGSLLFDRSPALHLLREAYGSKENEL